MTNLFSSRLDNSSWEEQMAQAVQAKFSYQKRKARQWTMGAGFVSACCIAVILSPLFMATATSYTMSATLEESVEETFTAAIPYETYTQIDSILLENDVSLSAFY